MIEAWSQIRTPVIGMLHLLPLPGAPRYSGDLAAIERELLCDAEALAEGGVHGLMIENFGDVPFYPGSVPAHVVSQMTRLSLAVRQRYVRCGKEGCHCRAGEGHGPVFYLSVSFGAGRTEQAALTAQTYEIAQRYAHNYVMLREVVEEVSAINREILREERRAHRRKSRDTDHG